ncbi:MAG TPA: alkaline phosphatase family protein, partial [Thermoanaerobaculia bacterium]|nr:alkaline phosphatase family protein [Thermoanaerobaculia bacterium]
YHTDAHHDHYPLFTGPGHSIHFTGAPPYKTGIVGNEWFDREMNAVRYCVQDPKSPLVGAPDPDGKRGISPITLRTSTVGDELKMATGGQGKVWGLALKDRAGVLMAGHLADGVLWFDEETSAWISSRFYFKSGQLPDWVTSWNTAKKIDPFFGKTWNLSVPPAALKRLWTPHNEFANPRPGLGKMFPHPVTGGLDKPGRAFYAAFESTPYANEYVLETAEELIRREKLGQDAVPDILAINLSTNDYIGHSFGPDSPEVLDVTAQTDRQLSRFFRFLGKAVPGGLQNVTIVLTADHGVSPMVEEMAEAGLPTAGGYLEKALTDAVKAALDKAFGPGDWLKALSEFNLYLDLDALRQKGIEPAKAEEVAAEALRRQPGIYAAYTRGQILDGRVPDTDIGHRVVLGFHPKVSGDVVIVLDPYTVTNYSGGSVVKGTTHGTTYAYDTSVPLILAGSGIKPGRYTQRVSTLDIAPTLSELLGVLQPSGCEGHVLSLALKP